MEQRFLLSILLLFYWYRHCIAQNLTNPPPQYQKIQIETQSRDYESGPIGGFYTVSTHDQMVMTVEDPGPDDIWRWAMYSEETKTWCDQTRIYERGNRCSMICLTEESVYKIYAQKVKISSLTDEQRARLSTYLSSPYPRICDEGAECFGLFQFITQVKIAEGGPEIAEAVEALKGADVVVSEPIKIVSTEYCFVWAYNLIELERVGYIFTEAEPMGSEGSYILYRLRLWITEANAMNELELRHEFDQTDYAAVITRRFQSKGLYPCLRYAHKAIEMMSSEPVYTNDRTKFWTIEFKVNTNTIIATLSDITFTIASRQHIALYGCFVGETRVMIDSREFSFLLPQRNELQTVNIAGSDMPRVTKTFLETKIKHIYGHYVQFIDRPWNYEQAEHRRDAALFLNPCMTLEFCLAVRGVSYMAQNWISSGDSNDIVQISLPGLGDDDRDIDDPERQASMAITTEKYIKAFDFAFTPTHLVVLTENSHIFLHPTSVIYKGFGIIRDTQSCKLGALVSRRWCASTGTTKEHNMIVPGFGEGGNFVIVQVMPTEPTQTIRIGAPSQSCLQKRVENKEDQNEKSGNTETDDEVKKKAERRMEELKMKREVCIHRNEIPKIRIKLDSDKQDDGPTDEECQALTGQNPSAKNPEKSNQNVNDLLKFWQYGNTLISERDPHFAVNEEDPALRKTDTSSGNFNRHILYTVDKRGRNIRQVFDHNGLDLEKRETRSNAQHFFWLHDVQFTAMERRFMLAVEFKSSQVKKTTFVMAVLSATTLDMPVRIKAVNVTVELQSNYEFSGVLIVRPVDESSSSSLPDTVDSTSSAPPSQSTTGSSGGGGRSGGDGDDSSHKRMEGRILTYTTNTALLSYVMHIDYRKDNGDSQDVLIYATVDGNHARPLSYISQSPSTGSREGKVRVRFADQHVALPDDKVQGVLKVDMILTEHGAVSVLLRKANLSSTPGSDVEPKDNYPQAVIVGNVITPEPLRRIVPFKGSSYIFHRITADGEIAYGDYSFENWNEGGSGESNRTTTTTSPTDGSTITAGESSSSSTDDESTSTSSPTASDLSDSSSELTTSRNQTDDDEPRGYFVNDEPDTFTPNLIDPSKTRFLATPYESLLVGNIENAVWEKKHRDHPDGRTSTMDAGATEVNCPYSDFVVHFIPFDFAEVEYRTRITAEITFLGNTIPLEADIIVEFDDIHGISTEIHSSIEETRDQTLVRKTIDLHTFLTPSQLAAMYKYSRDYDDKEEVKEDNTIFSITIRPSIVNLNCHKSQFFKTIQVNVGCNPFTSMRFIPEALGLKRTKLVRSDNYADRENEWTISQQGKKTVVTIPRAKTNFAQTKLFDCTNKDSRRGYCTIPHKYSRLFKENIYNIHFTKSVVPKFEQFLTQHVRRVTGNVFLYNILPGKFSMNTNTTLLDARCHNMAAFCPADEPGVCDEFRDNSTGTLANRQEKSPWNELFFENSRTNKSHIDIYRQFRDCYSKFRILKDMEKKPIKRVLPEDMQRKKYWIFNRTNYNAFGMEKHRNMIFVIRAVVLNTPDNSFTYCQRLETFFLLQLVGVAPTRQPLPWQFYLALLAFVLLIFVLVYFYFARSSIWLNEIAARRLREEEEKELREMEAKQIKDERDPVAQWAKKLRQNGQLGEQLEGEADKL